MDRSAVSLGCPDDGEGAAKIHDWVLFRDGQSSLSGLRKSVSLRFAALPIDPAEQMDRFVVLLGCPDDGELALKYAKFVLKLVSLSTLSFTLLCS